MRVKRASICLSDVEKSDVLYVPYDVGKLDDRESPGKLLDIVHDPISLVSMRIRAVDLDEACCHNLSRFV